MTQHTMQGVAALVCGGVTVLMLVQAPRRPWLCGSMAAVNFVLGALNLWLWLGG